MNQTIKKLIILIFLILLSIIAINASDNGISISPSDNG